jgi:hypothetical protein
VEEESTSEKKANIPHVNIKIIKHRSKWVYIMYTSWKLRKYMKVLSYKHIGKNILGTPPALGPTQPPVQRVPGALSLGVNLPRRETDHSPPSSAEANNAWSYTSTPQYPFMAWCSVKKKKKHKDILPLPFHTGHPKSD